MNSSIFFFFKALNDTNLTLATVVMHKKLSEEGNVKYIKYKIMLM